jgi:hypothetical protein
MHQVTGTSSVAVLKGEIHNVLALMRANARYSAVWRFTRESPDNKENPLVAGLKSLHESLVNVRDVADADTVDWLKPFLDIIVTPETSGAITGGALGSISKFLLYEFVRPEKKGGGVRADEGANRIAFIVCRCRFEATDTDGDEVVSMKIVQVLVDLMRCSAGTLLTDHSVYEICLACLGICSQARLSELLRRAAEHCLTQVILTAPPPQPTFPYLFLTQVILTVFSRLSCDAVAEAASEDVAAAPGASDKSPSTPAVWDERPESASAFMSEADEIECQDALDKREIWPKSIVFKPPHGVACMQKILVLLCQLTDPSKKDERSRVLGLSLLNVMLHVHPTLYFRNIMLRLSSRLADNRFRIIPPLSTSCRIPCASSFSKTAARLVSASCPSFCAPSSTCSTQVPPPNFTTTTPFHFVKISQSASTSKCSWKSSSTACILPSRKACRRRLSYVRWRWSLLLNSAASPNSSSTCEYPPLIFASFSALV